MQWSIADLEQLLEDISGLKQSVGGVLMLDAQKFRKRILIHTPQPRYPSQLAKSWIIFVVNSAVLCLQLQLWALFP
jgi:hypothetical protein